MSLPHPRTENLGVFAYVYLQLLPFDAFYIDSETVRANMIL
jgi:hypothetical protein